MSEAVMPDLTGPNASANACLACRKVKMKCHLNLDQGATQCDRCTRKSLECVFRKHRRGRRPAVKASLSEQDSTPTNTNVDQLRRFSSEGSKSQTFWDQSETFQPPDLLNKDAMKGDFSLEKVLSTSVGAKAARRPSADKSRDPLSLGIVNNHIATSLFDVFMRNLNHYICQLDPNLHTFSSVQEKSPFLLTACLAVAAKVLNPLVYPNLKDHAEKLKMECFRRGDKSPEIVQGILILTYWKESDDTRAWLSVGYAIRLCMDLGYYKLSHEEPDERSDLAVRERRNAERTWLVLFVYDRSISLQTGKPRMIDRSDFLENAPHTWYKHPLALPSDVLLCAFVALRLLTSGLFELLEGQSDSAKNIDPLLAILQRQVQAWQDHWLEIAEAARCERCNMLLIQFYGLHLRLLLWSFLLKPSLPKGASLPPTKTPAIWASHANALEMLRLVSQPDISPLLFFAQDSVHVMIAYATVFVVKLLLCVPREIQIELERITVETIRTTAHSFDQQVAPSKSSCWLQARFLQKVLREFDEAAQLRLRNEQEAEIPRVKSSQYQSHAHTAAVKPPPPPPSSMHIDSIVNSIHPTDNTTCGVSVGIQGRSYQPTHDMSISATPLPEDGQMEFAFSDDTVWETMFANAGFNIANGTFLPEVYSTFE